MTNGVAARQPRVLNTPFYDDISNEFEERSEPLNNTKFNQVPRLINGKETQPGAWPWQVGLVKEYSYFSMEDDFSKCCVTGFVTIVASEIWTYKTLVRWGAYFTFLDIDCCSLYS